MVDKIIGGFVAIVGVAGLAVIVSKRSNTASVVNALLSGFTGAIKGAVSPVTA